MALRAELGLLSDDDMRCEGKTVTFYALLLALSHLRRDQIAAAEAGARLGLHERRRSRVVD